MHHWWKHKRGQPLFNNFNQNYILQIYLPSDSSIPLRGIYARNISVWAWNKAWSRLFMASLFVVWRNKSNLLISRGWLRRSWSMHRMEYHVRESLSHVRLCDHMDCGLPGSSAHGILQARILERVAMPFSRGSSWPRNQTWVFCIAGRFFTIIHLPKTQFMKLLSMYWPENVSRIFH